jgi:pimeloyl-ACP methyl ester carboxylesterase
VLAGDNPFGVTDAASLERYLSILFHQRNTRPPVPWPATYALVSHRRREAGFEQSVLDRIGRGNEQFLPGEEAARIRQPTLLVWGAQDRVVDTSAMDLYAARIPQARTLLLPGCGHMSLMECPDAVADAVRSLLEAQPRPTVPGHEETPA